MAQPATSSRSSGDFPADWVFLDTVAHAGRCRRDNATTTTARARSSDGHPIEVSFALADPPALTRCLVHCPAGLTAGEFSRSPPSVAASDGAFLLLRVVFPHRSDRCMATDWFVYRQPGPAGAPPPSLELLVQRPNPLDVVSRHAGVLSRGDHCLVVDPEWGFHDDDDDDGDDRRMKLQFHLHIFSSKTKRLSRIWAAAPWRRSTLSSSPPSILLFDSVPGDSPEVSLIRLPPLMPINNVDSGSPDGPCVDHVRDVTCRNDGWFKFIEMGFPHLDPNDARLNRGWEATMFKRRIIRSDDDCYWQWEPCGTVDSASLLLPAADSCVPDCLFPEIFDYEERKLALNNVLSSFPTLDLYRDDVVYMMTKIKDDDPDGWIIAVNTESKRLEGISPFSQESYHLHRIYQQCDFSKHLINKALGTHLAKDMDKLMDQQPPELATVERAACREEDDVS
uniref:OSJNBa0053B21.5 protein n=1 Tax=Oryza sativa subsp. japonica TaxID=39947 RepID=Q7F9F0_ORYSJ|nr:OSJNBa0053B21.5 [Oryza sativa Japonica Group]